jgi:hypothetical protein
MILPNLMTEAINQMVFVPGLSDANIFAWIRQRKIVYTAVSNVYGDVTFTIFRNRRYILATVIPYMDVIIERFKIVCAALYCYTVY